MASEHQTDNVMEQDTTHVLLRRMKQMWSILTRGSTKKAQEEVKEKKRVVEMANSPHNGPPSTQQSRFLKLKNRILTYVNDKVVGNRINHEQEMVYQLLLWEREMLERENEVLERYYRTLRAVLEALDGMGGGMGGMNGMNAPAFNGDADSGIHM